MRKALYILCQCTWGALQSLCGLAVFLVNMGRRHYVYHGAIVTEWKSPYSASLGMFVFISEQHIGREAYKPILVHEYGHTLQSLMLGPLYLPAVALPSCIWCMTPALHKMRVKKKLSYYSFYTESWANKLGELAVKEPSMGQAPIY